MDSMLPYIKLMRPKQWIKNLFVATPLIFGLKLFDLAAIANIVLGIFIFCLVASSIYVFNDLRDIRIDKLHPKNCKRPIASGQISLQNAIYFLIFLLLTALSMAIWTVQHGYLSWQFYVVVLFYAALNTLYSLGVKHIPLLEMFIVASGYVLRVIAGCIAIAVTPSPWIMVAAGIISLLIVAGKRRAELVSIEQSDHKRKSVESYNIAFLDSLISMFGSATIMTYMLFTLSDYATEKFHTQNLLFTSIFVIFGVTRYIHIIKVYKGADAPTDLVTSDPGIYLSVLFWIISLFLVIYL